MKKNYKEVQIVTVCPFCGKGHSVWVNEIDYLDYADGEVLIQDAFPYLSADEREIIKTGICPTCWEGMFPADNEEEEEDFEDDSDWGYNEDEGFDPYEGCYTFDC